jgi:ABC-type spermidine/putrescine transport system permease subunit II
MRAAERLCALGRAYCLLILLTVPAGVLLAAGAPRADAEPAMVSVGVTDSRLNDGLDWPHGVALQFRFRPLRAWRLRPSLGIEAARDGESLVYAAVERDFAIGPCWIISPGLGVGSFRDGAMLELGSSLQFRSALALNLASLAGVPSVLFGLVGLELLVRALHLGHSMVTAALTLALVVLPIVAVAARSALRAVPDELREAGYALGATPWQVTRQVVLPAALPGILSGIILAIARAFGEAAPLLIVAGMTMPGPSALGDPRSVLPLHVLALLAEPRSATSAEALMGVVVLLGTLLVLSGWAMRLRHRHERRRDGPSLEDPR